LLVFMFFFQAEDGIRDRNVTGVQTCALPILGGGWLYFNDAQVQATANQTAWNVRDRIAKLIGRDDTSSNDNSNLHLNDTNNGSSKSDQEPTTEQQTSTQIGRASCRERE